MQMRTQAAARKIVLSGAFCGQQLKDFPKSFGLHHFDAMKDPKAPFADSFSQAVGPEGPTPQGKLNPSANASKDPFASPNPGP